MTTTFILDESFLKKFKNKQPAWGPVGYLTYKRTYARRLPDGKYEEFWQTLKRVVEGVYTIQYEHCQSLKLPWSFSKAQRSAQEMFTRMWQFKFLPPGRGLWMMGTDHVNKVGSACLNNCAFVSTADLKTSFSAPFCFLMDMSMLGVGVGGDTKGAGTLTIKKPFLDETTHVIPDTREGWVDAVRRVLDAYVREATLPAKFDFSQIRPAGTAINGFGGTASGSGPLEELLKTIPSLLQPLIGKKITSTVIVDLFNVIGRCVVSGNVRRSAEIMFGALTDKDFLLLKDPELHAAELEHHRWASNNSVVVTPGDDYTAAAERTARNGEPGYLWLDNARKYSRMNGVIDNKDEAAEGSNPCVEQTLESFELCCLVESFPANHDSIEDYKRTLKYSYLYAKTVTLVPTHDKRTNAVMLRNRRIGLSQSGIVQAVHKIGRREYFNWCEQGYTYVCALDKQYSRWMCVPESIKKTSVKPSGSVSLLPGATPGVHHPESEYHIRNVRCEENSPIVKAYREANYVCEKDVYTPNTTVVSVPVHEKYFTRGKADVSMWEQLEIVAQIQQHWADNQVSATITFNKNEAKDIKHALELYETRLKGISFLPLTDHGYKQAPYIPITKEQYEEMVSKLKPVDLSLITHDVTDSYCDGDKCVIPLAKVA